MLPIEAKMEVMPAALEVVWIPGTESRPTVALRLTGFNKLIADHVSYSRQEHSSLFHQTSAFLRGRGKVHQSYDEEKVLIFLDNTTSILFPDFLHSAVSPVILADHLNVF